LTVTSGGKLSASGSKGSDSEKKLSPIRKIEKTEEKKVS